MLTDIHSARSVSPNLYGFMYIATVYLVYHRRQIKDKTLLLNTTRGVAKFKEIRVGAPRSP